ncbi:MAG TPA: hypothetical protein VJL33_05610 [Candidatus Bathyarchaeia archaeon]|nr:hypothetical protein [Candidatus Bathyarchaeia archaeon]
MVNFVEYFAFWIFRLMRRLQLHKILHLGVQTRQFSDYFKGMENSKAVRGIFGKETEAVLRDLKVEFTWIGGYMFVDGTDGRLVINSQYLRTGDKIDIYLDLVHELYHVKQLREGRELFDARYEYVDRPTEIEAYRYTVDEARRLGLSNERILLYLKTEWMTEEGLKRLANHVGIDY